MTKPIINTFSQFAPLFIQEYECYLPTAFDESLSLLQKVNKVINSLDSLGVVSNNVITQWNSVMEWVMNDGLNESVVAKLDDMVSKGVFDSLIQFVIKDNETSTSSTWSSSLIQQKLDEFSKTTLSNNVVKISDNVITNGFDIGSLHFKAKQTHRNVLELMKLSHDKFYESSLSNKWDYISETGIQAVYAVEDGEVTLTNTSGDYSAGYYLKGKPSIPNFLATLDVKSVVCPDSAHVNPEIVMALSETDRISMVYRPYPKYIEFYEKFGGTVTVSDFTFDPKSFPFTMGMMVLNNYVLGFVKYPDTEWAFIGSKAMNSSIHDFNIISEQKSWKLGFGYYISSGSQYSMKLGDFKVFATGLGYRDPVLVTYRDGSPFIKDGRIYCTVTLGGMSVKTSYQGVISFNPDFFDVKLESLLYTERPSYYRYGDHAGQLIYDEVNSRFIALFSTWGSDNQSGAIKVVYAFSKDNLLTGIHTLQPTEFNLPNSEGVGLYDPFLFFDKDVNKWRIAYTKYTSPRTLALAESSDMLSWTLVSQKQDSDQPEGTKVTRVNNKYYVLGCANYIMRFYDYPTMNGYTSINVDKQTTHPEPHPMLIPIHKNGKTKYYILSMDKTQIQGLTDMSHGNLWWYEADESAYGYEYTELKTLWL